MHCDCDRNNKFYMVQLIEERGRYKVFRKWGRVGAKTPQVAYQCVPGSTGNP